MPFYTVSVIKIDLLSRSVPSLVAWLYLSKMSKIKEIEMINYEINTILFCIKLKPRNLCSRKLYKNTNK